MHVSFYFDNPEIKSLLADLNESLDARGGLNISTIRDAAGYQYVDLVMEGGGTLGVALLGYIYVLEKSDIRFLRLAGTSAGSIVSMLLAAAGPIQSFKSAWLVEKFATKDFYDFVDGDQDVKDFVDMLFDEDASKREKATITLKVIDDIKKYYGLNPGRHFHEWLTGLLREKGIYTLADLRAVRAVAPEGINCPPERWERASVVTAEITTGTKIALPDAAALYWADPEAANPADFVRASMSVPVFFYPFQASGLPQGEEAAKRWETLANYRGPIPPSAYFVDGGAMSNFPLSLLYGEETLREAPLLGIKIGQDRNSYNDCDTFGAFAGAMLGSMMAFYDNDFIVQHPELAQTVGVIDTGEHNWLDFSMSDEDKLDLFLRGARAAAAFLKNGGGQTTV